MKRLILVFFALAGFTQAFAQFEQGRMMVGGAVDLNSYGSTSVNGNTSTKVSRTTHFGLSPTFGYFVVNNFVVGGSLTLGSSVTKYKTQNDKFTSSSFVIGPFARYYFDNFFVHGSAGIGISRSRFKGDRGQGVTTHNVSQLDLGGGYAFFLNDNVTFEPQLGFNVNVETDKDSDPKEADLTTGLYLKAGFQIYLNKK
jgi:hypothetical protein